MYQLTVLYNHPENPEAFDKHYSETHIPLAKAIPGVLRYSVSTPAPGPDGAEAPYHLVAVLEFEDEAAFGAGMGSPEGQAAVADVPNFATGGATLLTGRSSIV